MFLEAGSGYRRLLLRLVLISQPREQQANSDGGALTAGWSRPRVFSLMARASFSRLAASLYLF